MTNEEKPRAAGNAVLCPIITGWIEQHLSKICFCTLEFDVDKSDLLMIVVMAEQLYDADLDDAATELEMKIAADHPELKFSVMVVPRFMKSAAATTFVRRVSAD